jgi:signal transduction histidine kinase
VTTFNLYPYLILVGGSILAATAWLLYQARSQAQRSQSLVQLNEQLAFDLPDFLRQCWPALQKGGFAGLHWRLDWYGVTLSGAHGVESRRALYEQFKVQEIVLEVHLYHGQRSWEQRYFSNVLAQNFFLLVRMDIWIKLGTVRRTFDQTAKLTVFLQHDMKNLLQLITLAADQIEYAVPGREASLLTSMRAALPAMRDRANHVLIALVNNPLSGKRVDVALADVFRSSAAIHELPLEIDGDAHVNIAGESLNSMIDNLLGNYAEQARRGDRLLKVTVSLRDKQGTAIAEIQDEQGAPCPWPERLFEPFWSEHGSGRGIGLYQSRQLAQAAGGNLEVEAPADGPLCFTLMLPSSQRGRALHHN